MSALDNMPVEDIMRRRASGARFPSGALQTAGNATTPPQEKRREHRVLPPQNHLMRLA